MASRYGFPCAHRRGRFDDVERAIRGQLVVLFPGTKNGNNYRLLDARDDGWNYLANGVTLHGEGTSPWKMVKIAELPRSGIPAPARLANSGHGSFILEHRQTPGRGLSWRAGARELRVRRAVRATLFSESWTGGFWRTSARPDRTRRG